MLSSVWDTPTYHTL